LKKICPGCSEERDVEQDFNWKYQDRGVRQSRCKHCQSQVSKQHYQNNKQLYMHRVRAREMQVIEDNRKRLVEYLAHHPCIDCGCSDIRVLEFDHVHGNKSNNIARMVGEGFSWSTIETEIAKCKVRCANCHRIKTNERSGWWRHLFSL
jgi:hypothetical protein